MGRADCNTHGNVDKIREERRNRKMSIKEFIRRMSEKYNEIYEHEAETGADYPGARLAAWAFDKWASDEDHRAILKEVIEERGDFISSDREAAAFMLTLEGINAL